MIGNIFVWTIVMPSLGVWWLVKWLVLKPLHWMISPLFPTEPEVIEVEKIVEVVVEKVVEVVVEKIVEVEKVVEVKIEEPFIGDDLDAQLRDLAK